MKQITRHGAYGVVIQESKILLARKNSGPYKGLWDLPGGAIEFGETPEEALKRELLEETALSASGIELWTTATVVGEYDKNGQSYHFHNTGIIYKVSDVTLVPHLVPEEEVRWVDLKNIKPDELTPFAKQICTTLPSSLLSSLS